MAIIQNVVLPSGVIIQNCYARIDSVFGNKNGMDITVKYYLNQQTAEELMPHAHESQYSFVPSVEDNSQNFLKQGYEYLKTLEEFEGALDA